MYTCTYIYNLHMHVSLGTRIEAPSFQLPIYRGLRSRLFSGLHKVKGQSVQGPISYMHRPHVRTT